MGYGAMGCDCKRITLQNQSGTVGATSDTKNGYAMGICRMTVEGRAAEGQLTLFCIEDT